jgi:hypothetical protein
LTLFAIYSRDAGLPEAVPERFSWFATLLPPVHALVHRLWDQLALWVIGVVAIALLARVVGADAAIWLYILLAVACGVAAPGAIRRAQRRRGAVAAGYRFAADADLARLGALEAQP